MQIFRMFALFEDDLTIIFWTAGFAAFGSSTSGYGYSPPSATTLVREDNRLKMCLLNTCESSVTFFLLSPFLSYSLMPVRRTLGSRNNMSYFEKMRKFSEYFRILVNYILSLQKIGCTRQNIQASLIFCSRFALSLHKTSRDAHNWHTNRVFT